MNKEWTDKDVAILRREVTSGKSLLEVARILQRSFDSVSCKTRSLGIHSSHPKTIIPKTPEDDTLLNRLTAVRSSLSACERDNRVLRNQLGRIEEFNSQVIGHVESLKPYLDFKYRRQPPKTSKPIVPVLDLSDWHIGEVVEANEVEGFNKFNWSIAQEGVFKLIQEFLNWVEIQRCFYRITECVVFCEGDFVSGDIHQELLVTNEFPLPVQTAKAGWLLGEVFRILAAHFVRVTVYEVGADNHGRLQKKPQAKQKSDNNMSYLVHTIANAAAERCTNLKPIQAQGMKMIALVNGKRFLLQHGDNLRGVLGIPFYAFAREIGREATKRMGDVDKSFDYMCIGHFHSPTLLEGKTIVNGSLSGTSEFDHACGRHALPCQVAFLIHPTHGVFNFTPFTRRT
jgi:hypothetical protein